nr:hypothetical protein [Pseudobdellovibrionaceae bacterium]
MEMNQYDVLITSVFGRGHWLAAELQAQKMKVLLLDLTSQMGVWPPEDGEGPFGVFRVERFADSFLESLAYGDPVESVENGFCVWLPSGPLEFKGPLSRFHWERLKLPMEWLEALSKGGPIASASAERDFSKTWPVALASQLSSTHYSPAALALKDGRPLPLAATFGIRFATRQGLLKNLEWLRERGVDASDGTQILDLSFGGRKKVSGAEMKGEKSGLVRFQEMIWTLTGGETRFLSERIASHLFPGGIINPSWCWVRYRLTVQTHPTLERLPLHVVLVKDLESPWTHTNLVILQKTASERSLDAWIRIPAVQRFNRGYVEEHGRRIVEFMKERLADTHPEIQSLPQESSYTSQELGEARFPVWTEGLSPAKTRLSSSNVHFESPENRESHGLDEAFDHQKELRDRLVRAWHLKQEKLMKEKNP